MTHNFILLGETILFSYFALVAGEALLHWFKVHASGLRRGAYALLAGYGAIGFGGMILGAFGAFTPAVLWSTILLILFLARRIVYAHFLHVCAFRIKSLASVYKNESWGVSILRLVIALWLIANFFIVFVPITGHDTLDYHLPVMRHLVATRALDLSATSFTPLPVFGETLYAVPIAMFHETAAPFMFQLIQYIVFALFGMVVYAFLKDRTRNSLVPLLGVLFLFFNMDLWREVLHGGYVDVIGFVYGMVSMLIVAEHAAHREARPSAPLSLSAFFLGVAAGIKYTGLIFGVFNGVILLVWWLWRKESFSRILAAALKYTLVVAVVAGFWYGKNAVVFQNPTYPIGSDPQATADINFFLVERTLPNLIIFPFVRYAQWFVQERETSSRLVVLGYFILMYVLLAAVLVLRRRLRASELILTAFIHFYFIVLFFLSHQYRFLLPAAMGLAILLSLLGSTLLDELENRVRGGAYRALFRIVLAGSVLVSVLMFSADIHYFAVKFLYATGLYSREQYILEIGGQ